jgi:hypothetical protein
VVIAPDATELTAEVPIVAVTVAASVAWLLGWKEVVVVPDALLAPDAGVKLDAAAPVPEADHTTVSPASKPELGHPAVPGAGQVTVAVML